MYKTDMYETEKVASDSRKVRVVAKFGPAPQLMRRETLTGFARVRFCVALLFIL